MCCDRYELLQITSFINDMIKNPLLIYVIEISSSSRAVQGEMLLRKDSTVSHKQSTLESNDDRVLKTGIFQPCFLDFSTMTFSQGHSHGANKLQHFFIIFPFSQFLIVPDFGKLIKIVHFNTLWNHM